MGLTRLVRLVADVKTRDLARGSSVAVRNSWLERRRLNHDSKVLSFFLREGEGGAPSRD